MAHPISFKPQAVDPQKELMRRVEAAPRDHAEALLAAWELLETAHEQGALDLARGLIGGRDAIAGKLSAAATEPEAIAALRNLIALGRLLGAIDPEVLHRLSRSLAEEMQPKIEREAASTRAKTAPFDQQPKPKQKSPAKKPLSLWQIFRRVSSADGRRGLSVAANTLTALGRASREPSE